MTDICSEAPLNLRLVQTRMFCDDVMFRFAQCSC